MGSLVFLLPNDIAKLIAKESDDDDQNYDKEIVLRCFKLSAEKFWQLFATHQKDPESTWRNFYFDLQHYFDGWPKELKELILSDQIKKKAPPEYKEHFLDYWS